MKIKNFLRKNFKNGFLLTLPEILFLGFNFIFLPIILKSLTQSDFGRIALAQSIINWINAFTFVNITSESKIGLGNNLYGNVIFAVKKRLTLFLPFALLTLMISLILILIGKNYEIAILIILFIPILIFRNIIFESYQSIWIAKGNFRVWGVWQVIMLLPIPIIMALSAYITNNPVIVVASQLISIIIVTIISSFALNKKFNLIEEFNKEKYDSRIISYGIKSLPANLITTTRTQITPILLGVILGYQSLAVFSIAYNRIFEKIMLLIKKINPAFYFQEIQSKAVSRSINRQSIFIVFLIGCIISLLLITVTYFYTDFFLPEDYYKTPYYVALLSLSFPFLILLEFIFLIFQIKLDYASLNKINIVRLAFIIVFMAILGYFFNVEGVCLGVSFGNIITFLYSYSLLKKQIQ